MEGFTLLWPRYTQLPTISIGEKTYLLCLDIIHKPPCNRKPKAAICCDFFFVDTQACLFLYCPIKRGLLIIWKRTYPFLLELEQGARLGGVLTLLGIPEEGPEAVVHNHRAGKKEQVLAHGDAVAVFPPVAGG